MTFSQIRQYIKGVLSNIFNKTLSNIAPKFNPTETYSIGDRVIYKGDLYRFTSAHTGAWTAADASKTNVNAYLNNNSMVACGGGYAPIGTVIAYMGTRAPSDFLICDGTVYNIADYTELADFFELQFGSSNFFGGDGNTTFAVPDLRGEFLRGTGTNSHANQGSGANVGVHQDGTLLPTVNTDGQRVYSSKPGIKSGTNNADSLIGDSNWGASSAGGVSGTSANYELFTSRPTNTSVLYCIKAKSQGNGYSLDEQIVGTWIDGKPLYQKTTYLGVNINIAKPFRISNPVENVQYVVGGNLIIFSSSDNQYIYIVAQFRNIGNNQLEIMPIDTWANDNNRHIYITLQYTKTTDTAS